MAVVLKETQSNFSHTQIAAGTRWGGTDRPGQLVNANRRFRRGTA
jgi:hypothetical protein